MDRRRVGELGEALALRHLEGLGFQLVDRNHRTRHGEIDLIVWDGHTLAFVEVKARRISAAMSAQPLMAIGPHKQARLRRLAIAWLTEAAPRPRARELRFDAVGVCMDRRGRLVSLEHVPGAF